MTVQSPICSFTIRELCTADTHACAVFIRHLDPDDIRLRFASLGFSPQHLMPPESDQSASVAFVATDAAGAVLGVVNLAPLTAQAAEIAVIVRSDRKRRGIGRALVAHAIEWAQNQRLEQLVGLVLAENAAMLALAEAMGFRSRWEGVFVEVRRAVHAA